MRKSPITAKAIANRKPALMLQVATSLVMLTVLVLCSTHARSDQQDASQSVTASGLPISHSLSGNYLAGRYAQRQQDWRAAQTYMGEVVLRDADNSVMMQRAFLLSIGAGRMDHARTLADLIIKDTPDSEIMLIFMASAALADARYDDALAHLEALPSDGFGDYTKPLLTAWAMAGKGRVDEAREVLDAAAVREDATFLFHIGLMNEWAGDDKAAERAYTAAMAEGLSMHSALLIADFFRRTGRPEISDKIHTGIGEMFSANPFAGPTTALNAAGGSKLRNVSSPAEGAAFAVFDIASLLYERKAYDSAQIYANIVNMMMPQSAYAHLMLGDIAALHNHYAEGMAHYDMIAKPSPLYWLSRLRVAEVYEVSGNLPAAAALLEDLSDEPATKAPSLIALGDIHRRQSDFDGAITAYTRALAAQRGEAGKAPVLYGRALAHSGKSDWKNAEKDLQEALSYQPDNPHILNTLGYSWADRGENLERAADYLRRAITLKPDDGAIMDSYGWVHYRKGDFATAIEWLEKAVAAEPTDATILDHLGDAYWRANRHVEAQFQWQRARDLSGDAVVRSQLEQKITSGLGDIPRGGTGHPEMAQQQETKI